MPINDAVLARLKANPYMHEGVETLASTVAEPSMQPSSDRQTWLYAATFVENLWTRAQEALLYWAPDSVETEARSRAQDGAPPSALAREVQIFTARYLDFSSRAADLWAFARPDEIANDPQLRRLRYVTAEFEKTLLALERRAMAVETRAMDLRMRYGFAELKRAFELGRAAEAVVQVLAPLPESPNEDHLRQVAKMLDEKLEPFAVDLAVTKAEVGFVADNVTRELGERWAGTERLKRYASSLATLVTSTAAKLLFGHIAGH